MVARNFKAVPGVDSQSDLITFDPAGAGAVQRTVESKLQDVVSVLDFIPQSEHAAIKAGSSTFDTTSAINAALAANKRVHFPTGTYSTTSNITIPIGSVITGDGNSTIIKPSAAVSIVFLQSGASKIFDLYIDGTNTGASAVGILLGDDAGPGCSGPYLARLRVQNFTGTNAAGIYIKKALRVVVENCYVFNNYNGLYASETVTGAYPTTVWAAHSTFANSTAEGAYINNGYQVCFDNCIFESNGKEGLKLFRGSGEAYLGKLTNCWFEDNQFGQPSRTSLYQVSINANGGTGGVHLDNIFFVGDATTAKSLYFLDVNFTSLSKVTTPNVADTIFADGTSIVRFLDNGGVLALGNTKVAATATVTAPVNYTLDQVGTFTATLTPSTSGSIVLNNSTCSFVRQGNVVTVCGQIDVATVSSPVGNLIIGGLPFPARSGGVQFNSSAAVTAYNFGGSVTQPIVGRISSGNNAIAVWKFVSGGLAQLAGDVIPGVTIAFQCTYFAD